MRPLYLVLAFTPALLATGCQKQATWREFSPEGGKFSVSLPGGITSEKKQTKGQLTFTQYAVAVPDAAYVVSYADLPEDAPFSFDEAVQEIVQAKQGKLVSQSDITMAGKPAKEFELEVSQDRGRFGAGRMVVLNRRLFYLLTVGATPRLREPDVKRFFDSFRHME